MNANEVENPTSKMYAPIDFPLFWLIQPFCLPEFVPKVVLLMARLYKSGKVLSSFHSLVIMEAYLENRGSVVLNTPW